MFNLFINKKILIDSVEYFWDTFNKQTNTRRFMQFKTIYDKNYEKYGVKQIMAKHFEKLVGGCVALCLSKYGLFNFSNIPIQST